MANLWDPIIVYDSTMADYWENQTVQNDAALVPLSANLVTGSIMEVRWARTVASGVREDLAMFALHMSVEAGPGAPMSRLDATDALRVETAFLADYSGALANVIANDWSLKELAWRHFGADFPVDKNGFSKPGTYWRVTTVNQAGMQSAARLPDQVALTTTLRTASRLHWGRFYLGGLTTASLIDAQMGHATVTVVDGLATQFRQFLVNINNDTRVTNVWVWSPKYRGACSINEVSVDDTFDIIRSRRAKFPSYRKTFTS